MSFKNFDRTVEQPFVIYADLESRLRSTDVKKGTSTTLFQEHIPIGYLYQLVSRVDPTDNKLVQYTATTEDEDVAFHFLRSMEETTRELHEKYGESKPMEITPEEQAQFDGATKCWVCGEHFDVDQKDHKVRDHCHLTGKYRGAAHNKCNLRLTRSKRIPVLFHNFTNYDNHLFIKVLGKTKGDIHVIARNDEKHISATKDAFIGDKKWQLRFSDTASFMLGSLATHVENLQNVGIDKFKFTREHFQDDEKFENVIRKGVFPYEWLTSVNSLAESELPSKNAFYSRPNLTGISDEDYQHAKRVWREFAMASMREYHDLYLKTDALLLADVFENFRNMALEHFEVDPCHYLTAPSMFYDALLKMTCVELELVSDREMSDFIERGKRGGVSTVMRRHAEANNKYMGDKFDPSKPSSYILYPDANSLYCWQMLQPLPVGNFRWLSEDELKQPLSNFPPCFVSVDLEYPEELHDKFKDYPPAPDRVLLNGVEKLAPNLLPKSEYVCHVRNILKYVELGCRITKVHQALTFDELPWMKPYIKRNIKRRK